MSIIEEARKAVTRRREWPKCVHHDRTLDIVSVLTRVTAEDHDVITLVCPAPGCFRHDTVAFRLAAPALKVAGFGMLYEAQPPARRNAP